VRLAPATAALFAVILTVTGVAGVVVLVVTGHGAEGVPLLTGLLAPVVAAMLLGSKLDASHAATATRLDEQDAALHKITRQTNGVLTQRIAEGVEAVLIAHGLLDPANAGGPIPSTAASVVVVPAQRVDELLVDAPAA